MWWTWDLPTTGFWGLICTPLNFFEGETLTSGILTYPLTFLLTDLVSEIWGRRRANMMVIFGFVMSLMMLGILQMAVHLSPSPYWTQTGFGLDDADQMQNAFSAVFANPGVLLGASMCAYMVAQLFDVRLYHFWRRVTRGGQQKGQGIGQDSRCQGLALEEIQGCTDQAPKTARRQSQVHHKQLGADHIGQDQGHHEQSRHEGISCLSPGERPACFVRGSSHARSSSLAGGSDARIARPPGPQVQTESCKTIHPRSSGSILPPGLVRIATP